MKEVTNQEKEPRANPFSKCPHKEDCFSKIMDFTLQQIAEQVVESLKDVKVPANEWRLYYRVQQILVRYPKPQPQHVDKEEAEAIKDLREHHKYSVSDLAFIFDRSKATIHDVLNRQ